MDLQKFKDDLSRQLYGKTAKEAIATGRCIDCGQIAAYRCYSDAGRREYLISGLCEACFDATTLDKEADQ